MVPREALINSLGWLGCDECHHAGAATYRKIFNYFRPRKLIGFTATPNRSDGVGLDRIFSEIIFQRDLRWVMSPDFSTYTDFPKAMQIYNHYRKHWCGAYMQQPGINVIPTISWSTPDSFAWCFDGEPAGGTVAVSSVGTQNSGTAKELFLAGYSAMVERLRPETIIFYGAVPKECLGNIVRIKAFQDRFDKIREAVCDGR